MTDYKDSINLPKTAFPMKAGLAQREPQTLKHWDEIGLYQRLRDQGKGRPDYILHDGPPYANGAIHIGHAVNKILKDIIVKSKTLSGFNAPYVPGWDCHGLPIELEVEKKFGRAGGKLTRAQFRQKCRDYAQKQVNQQRQDFIRLGVIADWQNPYLTMAPKTEAEIVRALAKIVDNGHVYHGAMPVYWCTECRSALAEAEVEYQDKQSPAIDVRFGIHDNRDFLTRFEIDELPQQAKISIPIWTTTPWTLPANQAVAVHPEFNYQLLQVSHSSDIEYLVLAEALANTALSRYGIEDYKFIANCSGAALEGLMLDHPFYKRIVPVILGEHVTTEAGTGAVHTAPGHGQEDYQAGRNYDLKVDNPVGPDGVFYEDTELFGKQFVFKANQSVIDECQKRHSLLHHESLEHSYPHCWRHKKPIIFRATSQWFIGMERQSLRQSALDQVASVKWLPGWGQARINGMIENRPDWCISRQRTWGVPIAVYQHQQSHALHPKTAEIFEQVASKIEHNGVDAWFDLDDAALLGDDANEYEKVTDILDVWFDSGVTHRSVLSQFDDLHAPADLYLEGSDQHRGWFQSSLLTSVAINATAPYRTVLTHGFTVDKHGKKMSKSAGNVIPPQKVINSLGADILRLWVAATDYRTEMTISDEILKRVADSYRRIRNTTRYLLGNLNDFESDKCLPVDELLAIDRWALARAQQLQHDIINAYDEFQFHSIYQDLRQFCVVELGGFYLDIIKDRLYTMPTNSDGRLSAQTVMHHILEAMVRWLAPILSFTAEEIWRNMDNCESESVLLETWYKAWPAADLKTTAMNQDYWSQVLNIRQAVSKELERTRSEDKIGSALEARVTLYCDNAVHTLLKQLEDELRFVLITSEATVLPMSEASDQAVDTDIEGLRLEISSSADIKCIRCWHRREDVGSHKQHPELCGRCISNIEGDGEQRLYA